ncbi:MAG: hypothetical protein ACR2OZ_05795 [Verrucomicrobiales bacterium]
MKSLSLSMLLLMLVTAPTLRAAADEDPDVQKAEAERAARLKAIKQRMKYFESHVGEWAGEETYQLTVGDRQKSVTKDEWKGLFSLDGTHFEMHGEGTDQEGGKTTYKWICTYDPETENYRAWYFDSNGNTDEFEMEWDDGEKTLLWTSEDDEQDRVSTFTMKVTDNEITGKGETTRASDDETLIVHSMKYKRKRIRI